jgi:hypothetical protein
MVNRSRQMDNEIATGSKADFRGMYGVVASLQIRYSTRQT